MSGRRSWRRSWRSIPALIFLRRWSEPAGVVMSGARAREAEELVGVRDRELDSVARIVNALARIQEPVDAARILLDEVEGLVGTDFNALALVDRGRGRGGRPARALGRRGPRVVERDARAPARRALRHRERVL